MSDITGSLIVTVLTGAAVIIIFVMVDRRKEAKEKALQAWCRQFGFTYNKHKKALSTEITIEGESFTLTSKMTAHRQEETTGSSAWEKMTYWKTRGSHSLWPVYTLGSISASHDWQSMSDIITNAAREKFNSQTKGHYISEQGRIVHKNDRTAYLLFEEIPGTALHTLDNVIPLLNAWPEGTPLTVLSDAQGISIRADNFFVQDTAQLDQITRLGYACAGWSMI